MMRMNLNPVPFMILIETALLFIMMLLLAGGAGGVGGEVKCAERERQALLDFKAAMVDDYGMLSSWKGRDCCHWNGVRCSNLTAHVISLDLHGDSIGNEYFYFERFLRGKIPSSLVALQHLRYLNLSFNGFEDYHIPEFFGNLTSLRYLDLSNCYFDGRIPSQIGSLSHLTYLNLHANNLEDSIPYQLGNLTKLQYLDLSRNALQGIIPSQLGNLSSLHELYLDGTRGSLKMNDDGQWLSTLTSLTHLDLRSILNLNNSYKWIQAIILRLSYNTFTPSLLFQWLSNVTSNLVELHLELDLVSGLLRSSTPATSNHFDITMQSLERLHISYYQFTVFGSDLTEDLESVLHNLSAGCVTHSLQELYLGDNQMTGSIPDDLSIFPFLKELDLSGNQLRGKIPDNIRLPSQLKALSISWNSIEGGIPKSFGNTCSLASLDLSHNTLTAELPVAIQHLSGCIYICWALSTRLVSMNISYNNLSGVIPDFPLRFTEYPSISLAVNHFEGPIPPFLRRAQSLDLSSNKFSDLALFVCTNDTAERLGQLDISNNIFSGQIPNCWSNFKSLAYIDVSSNNFSGQVPSSMGLVVKLHVLILRNNSFTGGLPISLKNCTNLVMLDAGDNRLSGIIPPWIGSSLQQLEMLSLRENLLSGSVPSAFCSLTSLHFLDLSGNHIKGQIPKCFKNFTAMAHEEIIQDPFSHSYTVPHINGPRYLYNYDIITLLMWKGTEQNFNNDKLLLKGIDLSSNHLSGDIPSELENLVELVSLNLSRNNLTGKIPSGIGRLLSLESLDLSRNHLFGSIPSSLAQISFLSVLDLSHNNLSGQIPTGTQLQSFNASSYEENQNLCGLPLENMCPKEEPRQESLVKTQDENDGFIQAFFASMGLDSLSDSGGSLALFSSIAHGDMLTSGS
ncbi:receptor-like protein EIX2 [Arachis duranensis]|uniref:Receptor-like protein EIX2 n=1 Tax=Arachis duranensis TaxID=130453 RepID=A0A6P5NUT7_ARADU|nr:receptor-like protein EIX2 [Arachis duranensis]